MGLLTPAKWRPKPVAKPARKPVTSGKAFAGTSATAKVRVGKKPKVYPASAYAPSTAAYEKGAALSPSAAKNEKKQLKYLGVKGGAKFSPGAYRKTLPTNLNQVAQQNAFLGIGPPPRKKTTTPQEYKKEMQAYGRGKNAAELLHISRSDLSPDLAKVKSHALRTSLAITHANIIDKSTLQLQQAQKKGNKVAAAQAIALRDTSRKALNELKQREAQGRIQVAKKEKASALTDYAGHPKLIKQVHKNFKQFKHGELKQIGHLKTRQTKISDHLKKSTDKLNLYAQGAATKPDTYQNPLDLTDKVPGTKLRDATTGAKINTQAYKTTRVIGGKGGGGAVNPRQAKLYQLPDNIQYKVPGSRKWKTFVGHKGTSLTDQIGNLASKEYAGLKKSYGYGNGNSIGKVVNTEFHKSPTNIALDAAILVPEVRGVTAIGRLAKLGVKAAKVTDRIAEATKATKFGKALNLSRINRAAAKDLKGVLRGGDSFIAKQNAKEDFNALPFKERFKQTAQEAALKPSKPEQYIYNVGKAGGKLVTQGPKAAFEGPVRAAKDFTTTAGEHKGLVATGIVGSGLAGGALVYKAPDFTKRALRDTHDLVTGSVTSVGLLGKAAIDAGKGDPTEIKNLWHGYKTQDPVALLIRGTIEGNHSLYGKALEQIRQRPVTSLLSFGGAYSFVGRTLGTASRLATSGEYGALAGERELFWRGVYTKKDYSPNIITKQFQKIYRGTYKSGPLKNSEGLVHSVDTFSAARWRRQIHHDIDLRDATTRNNKTMLAEETAHQYAGIGKQIERRVKQLTGKRPTAFGKMQGKVLNEAAGGYSDVAFFMGTRILRNKENAVADLASHLERIKKKNDITITPRDELPALQANIATLEKLQRHPEILTDPEIWNHVEALKNIEDTHQVRLVQTGQLSEKQAEMARWIPYAKEQMGAIVKGDRFYIKVKNATANKPEVLQELKVEDIKKHAENPDNHNGSVVTEPMFINMHSRGGPKNMFQKFTQTSATTGTRAFDTFPAFADFTRTGKGIEDGTYAGHFDSITQQGMMSRSMLEEIAKTQEVMHVYGHRQKNGEMWDKPMGEKEIKALELHYKAKFRLVEYNALTKQLQTLLQHGGEAKFLEARHLTNELEATQKAAIEAAQSGDKKFLILPEDAINRLNKHIAISSTNTGLNNLVQEFKGAVLPFSVKWQFGNISDMTIRSAFAGVNPIPLFGRSGSRGRKLMKAMQAYDKEHGTDFYMQTIARNGSGFLADAQHHLFESASDRLSSQRMYSNMLYRDMIKQNPLAMGVIAYRLAQQSSFALAGIAERAFRNAALSKVGMRHVRTMRGGYLKAVRMTPDVIEELCQGLRETPIQNKLTQEVNNIMGDYTRLSPGERQLVKNAAPFYLWLRASTRFVITLPGKYPIKTAMLASLNRLTEKEREEFGLSTFGNAVYKVGDKLPLGAKVGDVIESVPGFLQGAIPAGGGKIVTSNYTSFGTLYDLTNIANFAFPQFGSIVDTMKGLDWKGDHLIDTNGKTITDPGTLIGIAIQQGLTTYMPLLHYYEQLNVVHGKIDEASTPFHLRRNIHDSTYKIYQNPAESLGETLTRLFYPLKPIGDSQATDIPLGPNLSNVSPSTSSQPRIFQSSGASSGSSSKPRIFGGGTSSSSTKPRIFQ